MTWRPRGRAGFGPGPGLLILVIILGVIAAILIPAMGMLRENDYLASAEQRISALAQAVEAYHKENGSYPRAASVQQLAEELDVALTGTGDLRYECWTDAQEDEACTEYALGSPGLDGLWRKASLRDYEPPTGPLSPGADIVLHNGDFIQKLEARYPGPLFLIAMVGGGVLLLWFLKTLFWG